MGTYRLWVAEASRAQAMQQPRSKVSWSAAIFSISHTVLGSLAFIVALLTCLSLHYRRVVRNHVAGYPEEWWPSVSATIGDWFPERNIFQILCAATAGFRLAMIGLCGALASYSYNRPLGGTLLGATGVLRTFSCGGWIFVTSTDHSLVHDIMMGVYIGLTPIWMGLCLTQLEPRVKSEAYRRAQTLRTVSAFLFYACTPLMVYFYRKHRIDRIPGMYSRYALLEWTLVAMDVLFDSASAWDLSVIQGEVSFPLIKHEKSAAAPKNQSSPVWPWTVSQAFLAFTAWSTWFGLIPTIFYFSVSNMAAEGVELFVLSQCVGIALVAMTPIERLVRGTHAMSIRHPHPWILVSGWVASLCGGVASYALQSASMRLTASAGACALLAVLTAVDWSHAWETGRLNECVATWLVGLVGALVARYANHANLPTWVFMDATNGGRHVLVLSIAIVCLVPLVVPSLRQLPTPHVRRSPSSFGSFILASVALGTWLIEIQTLLSDSGTLIAFTWAGYPVRGPQAVPHGMWVVSAMAVSVTLSMWYPYTGSSVLAIALHALGVYIVLVYDHWLGFAGGLCIALTLPAMAMPLFHSALAHHPLRAMGVAWLTATFLAFLGVLTTAYAFLPGAYVMREHTGALLGIETAILSWGLWHARREGVRARIAHATGARSRRAMRTLTALLVALVGAASVVPLVRYVPPSSITPHHTPDRILTAGIWTVHFGFDQLMRDSTRRMSSILRTMELDIVGLLETDLHRPAFGNRDLTQWLAQDLHMYADLGPSPKKHTWGAVLLSKFPIINSTHHLLPSPHGELAPAIHAVLDIWGVPTHVVVSHNGQFEDKLDRELQTKAIARILSDAYPHPAIFLGYVVTKPHAPRPEPYDILFSDGLIFDVDPDDKDRWCQYLGFRGLERVGYARVSRYTVTDTELQTFKLAVPDRLEPNRDVRPFRVSGRHFKPAAWTYPPSLVRPGVRVNETHKYSPYIYPQYFEFEARH